MRVRNKETETRLKPKHASSLVTRVSLYMFISFKPCLDLLIGV